MKKLVTTTVFLLFAFALFGQGWPRFYWLQVEKSDSTGSFAISNGSNNGEWNDLVRLLSGPYVVVNGDTIATRDFVRLILEDSTAAVRNDFRNGVLDIRNSGGSIPPSMNVNTPDSLVIKKANASDRTPSLVLDHSTGIFGSSGGLKIRIDSAGESLFPYLSDPFTLDLAGTQIFRIRVVGGTGIGIQAQDTMSLVLSSADGSVFLSAEKELQLGADSGGNYTDSITIKGNVPYLPEIDSLLGTTPSGRMGKMAVADIGGSGSGMTSGDSTWVQSIAVSTQYVLYAEDFYTSDWAAAINTAIDSLNGLGGGTVVLPPDTLEVDRQTSTGATDYCILLQNNVNVTGNGTVLKVADSQVTDTYPTVHLMYGYELKNVTIANIDFIGNTAGQTGYTGGYQQGPSGATGIFLFGGTAARGNKFNLINTKFFDFFGAATTLQYTNNVHIDSYFADDCGELLEMSINTNVTANNIQVRNSLGGDGIEFAHAQNLILSNFQADSVLLGAGLDIYGANKAVISNGHLSYTAGLNLHHTLVTPAPANFIDSIYDVTISNVTATSSLGYGLEANAVNLRRTTISNFVAKGGTLGGGLFGERDSTNLNYEIELYDSQFDETNGQGVIVYNPWRVKFFNCSFSNNASNGIDYFGANLTTTQDSVGFLGVYNCNITGNEDFAISARTSSLEHRIELIAHMDENNADGGTAVDRNVSIGGTIGDSLRVVNTRPYKIGTSGQNYQYVGGDKKLINNHTQLRELIGNGVKNQSVEVYFPSSTTIVHASGTNLIQTVAGANLTAAAGDVIRFYYNQSDAQWYQEPSPWVKNLGLYAYTPLKVGIQRTVPGYSLDVYAASGVVMRVADATTSTLHFGNTIYSPNTTLSVGAHSAGQALYFNSPTANQLLTLSGASVGINDSSPDATLDVAGNMRLDGTFADGGGDVGAAGDVFTSTGSATDWVSPQYAQSHNTGGENTSIDAGTPEQVNATTTGTITTIVNTSEFTVQADGDLQYTGANNSVLDLVVDISMSTGGAGNMYLYIAINGTVQTTSRIRVDHDGAGVESHTFTWIDSDADTNDVYSVYAAPVSGTELVTITDMRIKARKIK